jgi:UDP-3-O-[3-hydroxymyristoyl] N-acetylglucosamine deacetylase
MIRSQRTLKTNVSIEGVGLHSGRAVRVHFAPAPEGHGIVLTRRDHPEIRVPALAEHALGFDHATTIGKNGVEIATVEHALSAAYALGLDNVAIDLEGPELPILDGSALPFVRLFQAAGLERQHAPASPLLVREPIEITSGDKAISVRPGRGLSIHYEIDFPHRAIGRQTLSFELKTDLYASRIAPARTFGLARDIQHLRQRGLARGGSLSNAIVLDEENILSGPLRFPDEFVRHKILDLLGDLSLLGRPLEGAIHARKAGHALHAELVRRLARPSEASDRIPVSAAARV